jgi:hypothetical protein
MTNADVVYIYIYIYASYLNSEFYANDFVNFISYFYIEFDCPLDKVECFSLELMVDPIKYKLEYVILSMFKYITCVINIMHWKYIYIYMQAI